MITELALRHWKSHEHTQMRFGRGTNLFVGSMGSGKTSAVEAVSFALFGTFPALKARRVRVEDLVSRGPQNHSAEVELRFEKDGKPYRVVRRLGREGRAEAQVFCDGKLLEAQPQRATELIEGVLRIDYDLFSRIIYAEQNRIDYLLNAAKGERKRQVDELLGISAFESARGNAGTLANRLKATRSEAQKLLEGMRPEDLREQLRAAESAADASRKNCASLRGKTAVLEPALRRSAESVAALEAAEREHGLISHRKSSLGALLARLREELGETGIPPAELASADDAGLRLQEAAANERIASLRKTAAGVSRLRVDVGRLEAELASLERQLSELPPVPSAPPDPRGLSERVSALEAGLSAKDKEIVDLSSAAAAMRGNLSELDRKAREKDSLESRVSSIGSPDAAAAQLAFDTADRRLSELSSFSFGSESALNALGQAGAQCPTCGSELSKARKDGMLGVHRKHLEEYSAQLSSVRKEREAAALRLRKAQQDILALESLRTALDGLKSAGLEAEAVAKSLDSAEKRLAEASAARHAAAGELERARGGLEAARRSRETLERSESVKLQIATASGRLQTRRAELSSLESGYSEETLASAESSLSRLQTAGRALAVKKRLDEAASSLSAAESRLAALAFDPAALSRARAGQSSIKEELARLSAEASAEERAAEERARNAESLRQSLDAVAARSRNLEDLGRKADSSLKFQSAVIETQKSLREELVGAITGAMQEVWPIIYPYRDYKSIRLVALEDDYALELQDQQDAWLAIEGCSGGERSCAALAMRVAFALVLTPGLSWLILDEPTHNLDARAVQALSTALHDRLPEIVEQVFIITHDEKLKEGGSGRAFFFERGKDDSGRTVVEEISFSS
ncbi:MAG: SMC family ATPase [Candidatus Micrarchaeota archaeon]